MSADNTLLTYYFTFHEMLYSEKEEKTWALQLCIKNKGK